MNEAMRLHLFLVALLLIASLSSSVVWMNLVTAVEGGSWGKVKTRYR